MDTVRNVTNSSGDHGTAIRVVFLIQDSLPNDMVGPEHTPTLWDLISGTDGGWNPDGGRSVLASSTYPNHASFMTGGDVQDHRIFANDVWTGAQWVPSASIGPAIETIFDAARRWGVKTSAVLGDHTMVGVMGADRADICWPPDATLPESAARDSLGYAANAAVLDAIAANGALDAELAVIHFNEPDSSLHCYGPGTPEVAAAVRAGDDDLATVVAQLRDRWAETVLIIVSDHTQETVDRSQPGVDLPAAMIAAGLAGHALNEGTIGLVMDGPGAEALAALPDVQGAIDLEDGVTLVWAEDGRVFTANKVRARGQHGSPRTVAQVAAVVGGHPIVPTLIDAVESSQPYAPQWAPTIAALFGHELPAATVPALIGGNE